MPWSTWKRVVQKKKGYFFFVTFSFVATVNAYQYLLSTSLKVFGRDTFSALAPVLGPEQKNWLCHPLPLFMAVSMIPNMWHSSCKFMRHSWLTKFGVLCLNQLVYSYKPYPHYTCFLPRAKMSTPILGGKTLIFSHLSTMYLPFPKFRVTITAAVLFYFFVSAEYVVGQNFPGKSQMKNQAK